MESPEVTSSVANEIICGNFSSPTVLHGYIEHWECRKWSPQQLATNKDILSIPLHFRIGKQYSSPHLKKSRHDDDETEILWERDCKYIQGSFKQFNDFISGECKDGPFSNVTKEQWLYADYKYMTELFNGQNQVLDGVDWGVFGFLGCKGSSTTFWMGTQGANTPCHFDCYGCNLVAQIYGRKRWVLFPPDNTEFLYPTRVPFEESSVFSDVNISSPNWTKHPKYKNCTQYEVVLEPGQVLFVPKHWWHYVECESTAISLNTWIELECDRDDRVEESLATLLTSALVNSAKADSNDFYNPKEKPTSYEEGRELLENAIFSSSSELVPDSMSSETTMCSCCVKKTDIIESKKTQEPETRGVGASSEQKLSLKEIINYVTHPETLTCIRKLIDKDIYGRDNGSNKFY